MKFAYFIILLILGCVNGNTKADKSDIPDEDTCTVIEECHACNRKEVSDGEKCKETGYVETLKCKTSGLVQRSCVQGMDQEVANFWNFEAAMIVTSLVAGAVVMLRMRKLDRENVERIQRQISAL